MDHPNFEDMSDEEVVKYRASLNKNNTYLQNQIGPEEHKRYVRDVVGNNPALSSLFAITIPGYDAAKIANNNIPITSPLIKSPNPMSLSALLLKKYLQDQVGNSRSQPSLQSIYQGYRGIGQGLEDWYNVKR